jgi:hypothetical protein
MGFKRIEIGDLDLRKARADERLAFVSLIIAYNGELDIFTRECSQLEPSDVKIPWPSNAPMPLTLLPIPKSWNCDARIALMFSGSIVDMTGCPKITAENVLPSSLCFCTRSGKNVLDFIKACCDRKRLKPIIRSDCGNWFGDSQPCALAKRCLFINEMILKKTKEMLRHANAPYKEAKLTMMGNLS